MISSHQHSLDCQNIKNQIDTLSSLRHRSLYRVSSKDIHSGKDFRGLSANPAEIILQYSGEIPLGHYGYGCSVEQSMGSEDVRQFRYLTSLPLSDLVKGHIRLVGPSRAGKTEFLFRLVVNLVLNYNWSLIWFSTKWQDDLKFFESVFQNFTAISANDISLTRITQGRLNPLSRIQIHNGRIDPLYCRKLAETLINLIPIQNISGDTEKFMRDAVVRLAAILELLKYHYGDTATIEQVVPLWVVLPTGEPFSHPLEILLSSDCVPAEAQHRLRRNLLPLLQRQPASEAMVGPTAQQLLSQIESLASVMAANEIANFSDRLRRSSDGKILLIDQSDGLNTSVSKGLARLCFPLLYEDLVAQCPTDWKQLNLRPVLVVVDEMNSIFTGELSDFLEKSLSKGVLLAFGQQSSAGNPDPRMNAAMSNNTRLQVVFSGCDATDPQVQELSAVAGRFTAPLEPHRVEAGFGEQERLPIDAVTTLGPLASLVRVKSAMGKDQIMWMHQGNPLVPYRSQILDLRQNIALEIAECHQRGNTYPLTDLSSLYAEAQMLLLHSYGYWKAAELKADYENLNLTAINQAYQKTMAFLTTENQKTREVIVLEQSRPEFARSELLNQTMTMIQWRQEQAKDLEAWLWESFLRDILPQLQWHEAWWSNNPIKHPRLRWWYGDPMQKPRFFFWSWGVNFPTLVGQHWQSVLIEYQKYAEAFARENPTVWHSGVDMLVNWRIGRSLRNVTSQSHRQLGGIARWLSKR